MPKMIFEATADEAKIFASHETDAEGIKELMSDLVHKNTIYSEEGEIVSTSEANKELRAFSREFVGLKEGFSRRDMKRAFETGKIRRYFDIIEEILDDELDVGYRESEWFNALVDYRNIAAGDAEEFIPEDDDLILDIAVVGKSHHDFILQRANANAPYTLPYVRYGAAVGVDINRYFAGQDDFAKLISLIKRSIMVKNQGLIYSAVTNAVTQMPVTSSDFCGTGTLTKSGFDTIVDNVNAIYGESVILGTKAALRALNDIADVDWRSVKQKEDVAANGILGSYETSPIIEIPQRFKDKTFTTKLMADDKIFVLPTADFKLVDFVTRGETEIDQIDTKGEASGRTDDLGKYEVQYEQGIAVKANKQFGYWDL